jgi:hypothetical protein
VWYLLSWTWPYQAITEEQTMWSFHIIIEISLLYYLSSPTQDIHNKLSLCSPSNCVLKCFVFTVRIHNASCSQ